MTEIFDRLWRDYAAINPQAHQIEALLRERGERPRNDHVAFRTFDRAAAGGIDALAEPFVELGYQPKGTYELPDKHLMARHWELAGHPKVFISELQVDTLDDASQALVDELLTRMPEATRPLCLAGRPWSFITRAQYERLADESEYAAWLAAFGFRANHFTVDVGSLESFQNLPELNDFLIANGFELNDRGGLIKGSPEVYLEQSSTRASRVQLPFADGTLEIPGCYYEFARRYETEDGSRFEGFIATSANRLFESTDR